jgi:hypothetical protein
MVAPNRNYELQKKITFIEFPYNRLNNITFVEGIKSFLFYLKYSFKSPLWPLGGAPIPPSRLRPWSNIFLGAVKEMCQTTRIEFEKYCIF